MASPAASAFLLLGAAVLAGFLGQSLFRRRRVSDILVLLGFGYLIGPALGILDAAWLAPAMPVLAPMGLVIILFEGGLGLKWEEIRRHGWGAIGFSLVSWTASVGVLSVTAHFVLGMPLPIALLFGAAVGATGVVAVIPILAQLDAPPKARVWLTVETGLGDLLSAVAVTGLATFYLFGGGPSAFAFDLSRRIVLGAALGFVGGLALSRALHALRERAHAYPVILAGLLVTYAFAELLGGSGYLAALVFGVIVGNAALLMRDGGVPALATLSDASRQNLGEFIFLLRSVFFVYLGMSLGGALANGGAVLAAIILTVALAATRIAVVASCHRGVRDTGILLAGMMPRAMAAAVLASIPGAMGVPGSEGLLSATLLLIVGSDIATSIGLMVFERSRRQRVLVPNVHTLATDAP